MPTIAASLSLLAVVLLSPSRATAACTDRNLKASDHPSVLSAPRIFLALAGDWSQEGEAAASAQEAIQEMVWNNPETTNYTQVLKQYGIQIGDIKAGNAEGVGPFYDSTPTTPDDEVGRLFRDLEAQGLKPTENDFYFAIYSASYSAHVKSYLGSGASGWHTYSRQKDLAGNLHRLAFAYSTPYTQSHGSFTRAVVHEIAEGLTNPFFSGWHASSCDWQEIGDLCWRYTRTVTSPAGHPLSVQALWSNTLEDCTYDNLTPASARTSPEIHFDAGAWAVTSYHAEPSTEVFFAAAANLPTYGVVVTRDASSTAVTQTIDCTNAPECFPSDYQLINQDGGPHMAAFTFGLGDVGEVRALQAGAQQSASALPPASCAADASSEFSSALKIFNSDLIADAGTLTCEPEWAYYLFYRQDSTTPACEAAFAEVTSRSVQFANALAANACTP